MNNFWRSILDGLASIGEGFASIGEGFSLILSFGASQEVPHSYRETLMKTDSQAIREDWEKIGDAFRTVIANQKAKSG